MPSILRGRPIVYNQRRNVHIPNPRFLRRVWLLPAFPHIFRVHINQLGLWGQPLLRRHQRHDRLLSYLLVEVLLGLRDASHLHCKFFIILELYQPDPTTDFHVSRSGSLHLQLGTMEADQVPGLRVSLVDPCPGLGNRSVIDALHTWLHGLRLDDHTWRQRRGKLQLFFIKFSIKTFPKVLLKFNKL